MTEPFNKNVGRKAWLPGCMPVCFDEALCEKFSKGEREETR